MLDLYAVEVFAFWREMDEADAVAGLQRLEAAAFAWAEKHEKLRMSWRYMRVLWQEEQVPDAVQARIDAADALAEKQRVSNLTRARALRAQNRAGRKVRQ